MTRDASEAAPSEAQRAFVLAAHAVGLPRDMICRGLPRDQATGPAPSPERLEALFAAELRHGPTLALRLIIARILERALLAEDENGTAAQMAVLRSVKDWPALARDVPEDNFDPSRLTRQERAALRKLLHKAQAG